VVTDKSERVYAFHKNTLHNLAELLGAAGLTHPSQVTADHIMVRGPGGQAVTLASTLAQ
jgi:glutamate synthase domain-containing protein 2